MLHATIPSGLTSPLHSSSIDVGVVGVMIIPPLFASTMMVPGHSSWFCATGQLQARGLNWWVAGDDNAIHEHAAAH